MPNKKLKMKVNTYDDLFGDESAVGDIREIPLDELYAFKNHPFRVVDDEKMMELAESIREYGVLVPGIVRAKADGGYEIISGHRRKRGCELAGLTTMPVIIRDYSDMESVWSMVDSNIQRENILPSEKSKAYKMKYDAIKHQGSKSGEKDSLSEIGEMANESAKTVQRYICLSRLNDDLLEMVDEKKIKFGPGLDLSYLTKKEQNWVVQVLKDSDITITSAISSRLKAESRSDTLTKDIVRLIMLDKKPRSKRVLMRAEILRNYFPDDMTENEIERVIIGLLDEWKAKKCG